MGKVDMTLPTQHMLSSHIARRSGVHYTEKIECVASLAMQSKQLGSWDARVKGMD